MQILRLVPGVVAAYPLWSPVRSRITRAARAPGAHCAAAVGGWAWPRPKNGRSIGTWVVPKGRHGGSMHASSSDLSMLTGFT
jgi:hypothetical protein